MKKVTILQHRLLHYRLDLFEKLKIRCEELGIELNLVHGQASKKESLKKDEGYLPWAVKVKNNFISINGVDVLWQPITADTLKSDLIIIMQENRILSNYIIQILKILFKYKVAYWGHGYNFQSKDPEGIREIWKKFLLKSVNWWFAYTDMTVNYLLKNGYSKDKITCLNNAIDNNKFQLQLNSIDESELEILRGIIGISGSDRVALFCGSLYEEKRIDVMIESALIIKEKIKDFQLIVIGDGPLKPNLEVLAKDHPWIHVVGIQNGIEKAKYFKLASIMFNPGLVGLHIVDAFCSSLVMVTLKGSAHSPEISYLENRKNGLIVDGGSAEYAAAIIELYNNSSTLASMQLNSKKSSEIYTLENMVENFAQGIKRALNE